MNWLLALLTAALLILTFPSFQVVWLAPVAVAPLLIAMAREWRPWRRALLGWFAGTVFWFGVCYWIQYTLAFYGGVGNALGWALLLLFAVTKGLHLAVFALAGGVLLRRWWAVPAVAALWVAIEATHGSLGFAWLALGNAGISMSVPLRLAPITGVWGLSFVFMMMATALALAVLRRSRLELLWLLALPFLVFLPPMPPALRGQETAVLLQPNVSETERWTTDSVHRWEDDLTALTERSALLESGRPPSIAVWPEIPAPFYYYDDERYRRSMDDLARAMHAYLLIGDVAHEGSNRLFNSATLISPEGIPVSRYDKVNLVPFGEFVPWPFGFANKLSTEVGDFSPGRNVVVSSMGPHRIGTFICYESVFPNFVRRFVAGGAEVLFNISNDGWFGDSAAREQHLTIVRMRAAENRRWILRSTNDGITGTIDPAGRVRGTLPLYTQATSYTGFRYISEKTFYTRHGDWFPILCAVFAAILLACEIMSMFRRAPAAQT
ncbi:MAG: apolipoprotein N-acyltransferase [Acidobacteriia bacterium]|nr:apolipoprotein N-acyltransferase [Terriglobia bacterium]